VCVHEDIQICIYYYNFPLLEYLTLTFYLFDLYLFTLLTIMEHFIEDLNQANIRPIYMYVHMFSMFCVSMSSVSGDRDGSFYYVVVSGTHYMERNFT
jgi:hypothetical protein